MQDERTTPLYSAPSGARRANGGAARLERVLDT
jgi:hypothetical protein